MRRRTAIAGLVALCSIVAACADDSPVEVRSALPIGDDGLVPTGPAPSTTPSTPATPADSSLPATTVPGTDSPAPTTAPLATAPTPTTAVPDGPIVVESALYTSVLLADVVDVGDAKPVRAHDEFLAVAIADVERWWADQFPLVYGGDFVPLQNGIYAGYPERTTAIPGCNERETEYVELQLYVAFYCNTTDFIAYDDGDDPDPLTGSLLTPLADEFGPAVVGVVIAHEYGHVVQERIGALDRPLATIVTEQQADCFAGAWAGQAYRGESPFLQLGDADVRAGLLAMLEVRDPVGTSQFVEGGHGSAFDRVGAFQVGFNNGAGRCAELIDDPLPLMPNQFRSTDDLDRGGDASYDCTDDPDPDCRPAPEFLAADVDHFWRVELGDVWRSFSVSAVPLIDVNGCADGVVLTGVLVVCPSDRAVIYDDTEVRQLYAELGDFTLGYLYGIASAELVQLDLGTGLVGEARALVSDCLTGAWVRDITPDDTGLTPRNADLDGDGEPDSTVASSPGDLDEAIQMALLVGDIGANVNVSGTAFEKIEAFRRGVLGGVTACGIS